MRNTLVYVKEETSMISIHTFSLILKEDKKLYKTLEKALEDLTDRNVQKSYYPFVKGKEKGYVASKTYKCFRDTGINRIILKTIYEEDTKMPKAYKMLFVINPKHLLGDFQQPFTTIISPELLPRVSEKFNDFIHTIAPTLPDITEKCILCRIDYCFNFWMNSQEEVEEYFKLLQASRIPAHFKIKKMYNSKQHRKTKRKGELTLECKSYELSLYLKKIQLDKAEYCESEEVENATGQLRIELRYKRKKNYQEKKKLNINEEWELLEVKDPQETLGKKLKKMYGIGDFYKYKDAIAKIEESPFSMKVKINMRLLLDITKKSRNLTEAEIVYGKEYVNKTMRYFNKLNLSPITIPTRSIHDYYPNPIKYIMEESTEYLRKDN